MPTPSELFGKLKLGKILDVATGTGYFLNFLLEGNPNFENAVGIDLNETARINFQKNIKDDPRISFEVMDGSQLDYDDDSFDTVCISHSLHHCSDPAKVLSEMKRVLRPGGMFFINEMYQDGNQSETQRTHILMHHWLATIDNRHNVFHRETYKRDEIVEFAQNLGLQIIELIDLFDLSEDPMAPEIAVEFDPVIDSYIKKAEGYPEQQSFGEEMRQRMKTIGFHNASNLLVKAMK